jgi:hypothetical protein
MSKVINYISPSIPRVLINRTYVKPPASKLRDDPSDSESENEVDFREDHIFDAYLLGDCDSVTQALAQDLRWPISMPKKTNAKTRRVDAVAKPLPLRESSCDKEETNKEIVNRTFVFQGAILEKHDNGESDVEVHDVVHCDGCQQEIVGTIMKCDVCFDFDVCVRCFPKMTKRHFKGSHPFSKER